MTPEELKAIAQHEPPPFDDYLRHLAAHGQPQEVTTANGGPAIEDLRIMEKELLAMAGRVRTLIDGGTLRSLDPDKSAETLVRDLLLSSNKPLSTRAIASACGLSISTVRSVVYTKKGFARQPKHVVGDRTLWTLSARAANTPEQQEKK